MNSRESLERRTLQRLRRVCLALAEASETTTFGHPTFQVGKKTFAVLEEYQGVLSICVKTEPVVQAVLLGSPRFYRTPYVGRHGWVSLKVEPGRRVDWREVVELVRESYLLVAPRRLR